MTNPGCQGKSRAAFAKDVRRRTGTTTGVTGVSFKARRRTPTAPLRHYFVVSPHRHPFCIETLGRAEAFRRAVALRAEHERAVAERTRQERSAA